MVNEFSYCHSTGDCKIIKTSCQSASMLNDHMHSTPLDEESNMVYILKALWNILSLYYIYTLYQYIYIFWFIEACMYVVLISVCLWMNSLCRCGCSRLAGLYWHGTSLCLCSLLSQWAAILCKHSTIPAMMPHYVPVETYSPPFAEQWILQHTSWRWEHNETSRWYILNSVRAQGLLGNMDNEPYFLKKNC